MHQLRRPLPRLASLPLFTLGAAGSTLTLGGCEGEEEVDTRELLSILRVVCETYQSCDPEYFTDAFGTTDECFDYVTGNGYPQSVEDWSQTCVDEAVRFWDCSLEAYEGCYFDAEVYARCEVIGDALLEECGFDYDYYGYK